MANHILLIAKFSVSKARFGGQKNVEIVFEMELALREKYLD